LYNFVKLLLLCRPSIPFSGRDWAFSSNEL